jgi:hypothetical protein
MKYEVAFNFDVVASSAGEFMETTQKNQNKNKNDNNEKNDDDDENEENEILCFLLLYKSSRELQQERLS